jgi:hypothetical protein
MNMKRFASFLSLTVLLQIPVGASIFLTGVFDGVESSSPKGIELYVSQTGDYSGWKVDIQSNANTTWSEGYVFQGSYNAGDFIYLTSTATKLTDWGWDVSKGVVISDTSFNQNGNDTFRVVDAGNQVIDILGEDGIDGLGKAWEYTDSYAYRLNGTGPTTSFVVTDWTFPGPNYLEGADINQQNVLTNVFGTYTPAAVPEPATIASIMGLLGLAFVMVRRRR